LDELLNFRQIDAPEESDRNAQQRRKQQKFCAAHDPFAIPPPISPTGTGSLVKKFQLMEDPPW